MSLNYCKWTAKNPEVDFFSTGNCAIIKPSEISAAAAELIEKLIPQYLDEVIYFMYFAFMYLWLIDSLFTIIIMNIRYVEMRNKIRLKPFDLKVILTFNIGILHLQMQPKIDLICIWTATPEIEQCEVQVLSSMEVSIIVCLYVLKHTFKSNKET